MCCTVIEELYRSEVNNEYVIRGNSVVLKCSIPPFIADFVTVVSWQDNIGNMYHLSLNDGKTENPLNRNGINLTHQFCYECTYESIIDVSYILQCVITFFVHPLTIIFT